MNEKSRLAVDIAGRDFFFKITSVGLLRDSWSQTQSAAVMRLVSSALPNSGVAGKFLEDIHNMFKARAMRMGGLLRQIDEAGHRTELMLRMAAERMEAAEARLGQDLLKQGLASGHEAVEEVDK